MKIKYYESYNIATVATPTDFNEDERYRLNAKLKGIWGEDCKLFFNTELQIIIN